MKIQVSKKTRDKLKEPNKTINQSIEELISSVEEYLPIEEYINNTTTLTISEETADKLKAYALTPKESYENILLRIYHLSKDLNTKTY